MNIRPQQKIVAEYTLPNEAATVHWATQWAQQALTQPFNPYMHAKTNIFVTGPMGIGKSVLIRAILRSIKVTAAYLPSPTYTLMHKYTFFPVAAADPDSKTTPQKTTPPAPQRTKQTAQTPPLAQIAWHIDLYRLSHEDELLHSGIHDCLTHTELTLIEWAERFPTLYQYPHNELKLSFIKNAPSSIKDCPAHAMRLVHLEH